MGACEMRYEKSCGAVVYREKNNEIMFLTIKNRKGQHWCFPKGHVECGETEEEAAIREVYEEAGLKIELVSGFRFPVRYSPEEGVLKETVFFLGKALSDDVKVQELEVEDYKWLKLDEAIKILTYETSKDALSNAAEFLGQKSVPCPIRPASLD